VLVEAEDFVTQGLSAGEGVEQIQDGWSVEFDQYLVALGHITFTRSSSEVEAEGVFNAESSAPHAYVVNLKAIPTSGLELWRAEGMRAARWDVSYETPLASEGAVAGPSVSAEDAAKMNDEGLTYLISGELTQTGGLSCPPSELATPPEGLVSTEQNEVGDSCYPAETVRFEVSADAETVYGPCELDGVPGVAVPSGGEATVALTLHVDHLFFNGFPEGAEGGISRRAQWLANSDLNLDGVVTMEELAAISPDRLLDPALFQLGGSPLTPLDNLSTYVRAQLKTQGHYQGEGECAADGITHNHDDYDDHDDHK
jgi:hypothetical protein